MSENFDFSNFLTDEEAFRMEMDKYIPSFFEHQRAGTLDTDKEFQDWTARLVKLSQKAGIDLQKFLSDKLAQR